MSSSLLIQTLLNSQNVVILSSGNYLLDNPLKINSNQKLIIENGVMLQPSINFPSQQGLIDIRNVNNVSIDGNCILDGLKNIYPSGQFFGIWIDSGSTNVSINNVTCQNIPSDGYGGNRGDGIYIGSNFDLSKPPTDINIKNCKSLNNGRVGFTITAGKHISINNCISSGNFSQGIDIEPNNLISPISNINIKNNFLYGNFQGLGLGTTNLSGILPKNITITENIFEENIRKEATISYSENIIFSNNIINHIIPKIDDKSFCVVFYYVNNINVQNNIICGAINGLGMEDASGLFLKNVNILNNIFSNQVGCAIGHNSINKNYLSNSIFISNNSITSEYSSSQYIGINILSNTIVDNNKIKIGNGICGILINDLGGTLGEAIVANNKIITSGTYSIKTLDNSTLHIINNNILNKPIYNKISNKNNITNNVQI